MDIKKVDNVKAKELFVSSIKETPKNFLLFAPIALIPFVTLSLFFGLYYETPFYLRIIFEAFVTPIILLFFITISFDSFKKNKKYNKEYNLVSKDTKPLFLYSATQYFNLIKKNEDFWGTLIAYVILFSIISLALFFMGGDEETKNQSNYTSITNPINFIICIFFPLYMFNKKNFSPISIFLFNSFNNLKGNIANYEHLTFYAMQNKVLNFLFSNEQNVGELEDKYIPPLQIVKFILLLLIIQTISYIFSYSAYSIIINFFNIINEEQQAIVYEITKNGTFLFLYTTILTFWFNICLYAFCEDMKKQEEEENEDIKNAHLA